jgi:hypothetical protein
VRGHVDGRRLDQTRNEDSIIIALPRRPVPSDLDAVQSFHFIVKQINFTNVRCSLVLDLTEVVGVFLFHDFQKTTTTFPRQRIDTDALGHGDIGWLMDDWKH